jgi:short-subunit dehydrogenase
VATALITGATSGIGAAYANLLANEGFDLVLVARDLPRLKKVAKELGKTFGIKTECIKADLNKPIEVLVNNAGFGIKDSFLDSDLNREQELLDVLVTAPMRLTHALLPGLVKRNEGVIVNVSSVASFIAGGTYSAAKSYLTVFTEYLHTELKGTNIKVSALCPGFTKTEFHARGKMKMGGLPNYMWSDVNAVVKKSWKYAKAGKAICIPGWQYMLLSTIARVAPRPLVRKVGINVRRKQR